MISAEAWMERLQQDCGVCAGSHVLAAVSGGADSTALLCFFCEIREKYPLEISCAHVEHGIRGAQSLADMEFVRELCRQKNVPFYSTHADVPDYAKAHGCGIEDAARTLRYAFLVEIAKKIGADAIAMAHHRRDQAETVLLHAARGSDLRGLCAMRMRRGRFIRPFLNETPENIRAYLNQIGQAWREDETNACEDYARNRVRLTALPALEAACPGAEGALASIGVVQRVASFVVLPLIGMSIAIQPLLGFNYGAHLFKRVKMTLAWGIAGNTVIAVVLWALVHLFPVQIVGFFGITDPNLLSFTVFALQVQLFLIPFVGFQIVGSNYFQATGQPAKSVFLSLTRQILFLIPLYIGLPMVMPVWFPGYTGLDALYFACPVADFLAIFTTGVFVLLELKRLRKLENGQLQAKF